MFFSEAMFVLREVENYALVLLEVEKLYFLLNRVVGGDCCHDEASQI